MSFAIDRLQEKHIPQVFVFSRKYKEEKHEFFRSKELSNEDKSALLDDKKTRFVVLKGDLVVGFFFYYKIGGSAASVGYAVLKEYQGRGLGKEMLRYIKDHSKQEGYSKLFAYVDKSNWKSIILLIKAGFFVKQEVGAYLRLWCDL